MLQKEADPRHWRHETPFGGGIPSSPFTTYTVPKSPPRAYYPAPEMSQKQPSPNLPHDQFYLPPRAPSSSRNASLSAQTPPGGVSGVGPSSLPSMKSSRIASVRQPSASPRATNQRIVDPEKSSQEPQSVPSHQSSNQVSHHSTIIYEEADEDECDHPRNHTVWILTHLSAFNPFIATCLTVYALATTVIIGLLTPLCLCTTQQPIRTHFVRLLVPPLRFQLGLLFSNRHIERDSHDSTAMLILCYLFAPFVAMGVCVAAWVAAAFWLFANILGNPNVNESKEDEGNEGRAAVMAVRNFWEAWLLRGLR